MSDFGATTIMPPRKRKAAGGRPKAPKPVVSLVSLKGTDDFENWLDGLVDHAHQGTRTLLLKNALREYAEGHGYGQSMPKR